LVNATTPAARFEVTCDMPGLTSRAGTALLTGLADAIGFTGALVGALSVHSRGVRQNPAASYGTSPSCSVNVPGSGVRRPGRLT